MDMSWRRREIKYDGKAAALSRCDTRYIKAGPFLSLFIYLSIYVSIYLSLVFGSSTREVFLTVRIKLPVMIWTYRRRGTGTF